MNYKLREKIKNFFIYGSCLFVFLLPWQTRWIFYDPQTKDGVWEYGRMSLYAFDMVFISLVVVYAATYLFDKILNSKFEIRNKIQVQNYLPLGGLSEGEKLKNKNNILIFLGAIFVILNIIFSADKFLAFYWWLRLGEGAVILWILGSLGGGMISKVKIAWAFIIGVTISAGLGIYQFLTQSAFASKWLGLAWHGADQLGASVIEVGGERWFRAYGSLSHPNVLAGFIIIALVLLWGIIGKIRNWKLEIGNKIQIINGIFYIIVLLLVTGLFFTFSRASWLTLLLIIIGLIIHYIYNKKFLIFKDLIKILFFALGVLVILAIAYWPLVGTRLGMTESRLEIKSNQDRIAGYGEAWQVFKKNPLIGVGMGNYTAVSQKLNPGQAIYNYQPVHNVYLLLITELGIFGWLGLLGFWGWLGKRGGEMVLMSSLLFLFLFDHFWWTLPSGLMVMAMVIGIMIENKN